MTATVVLDGMRIRAILTPVGAELHTNPTVHMLPPGSVEEANVDDARKRSADGTPVVRLVWIGGSHGEAVQVDPIKPS